MSPRWSSHYERTGAIAHSNFCPLGALRKLFCRLSLAEAARTGIFNSTGYYSVLSGALLNHRASVIITAVKVDYSQRLTLAGCVGDSSLVTIDVAFKQLAHVKTAKRRNFDPAQFSAGSLLFRSNARRLPACSPCQVRVWRRPKRKPAACATGVWL